MHTIKLVVIGDSGVGKTSLRGQVRPASPPFSTHDA
jgi:GTPase SAR1 family protein